MGGGTEPIRVASRFFLRCAAPVSMILSLDVIEPGSHTKEKLARPSGQNDLIPGDVRLDRAPCARTATPTFDIPCHSTTRGYTHCRS